MKTDKKIFLTIVYIGLLALLHAAIFALSAQDGDASGELSMRISGKCTELFGSLSGKNRTEMIVGELAENFERPLRKTAHFTEYACMGALVYLLIGLWAQGRRLPGGISAAWVFVSAGLDEFHQYFVPGRYASFFDVCLDTLGGVAGMIFVLLLQRLFCRLVRR